MTDSRSFPPIVIVGAGAAGLLAAIFAAGPARERGRRVVLLERTRDGGRKILVSGGGRCNVLPSRARRRRGSSPTPRPTPCARCSSPGRSPSSGGSSRRRWGSGSPWSRRRASSSPPRTAPARCATASSLSPAGAASRSASAPPSTGLEPPAGAGEPWTVRLAGGEAIPAAAVVLATGGLSLPGTGSDGAGLAIVRRLGHTVHATYPALTPLTADPPRHAALAGISLDRDARARPAPQSRPRRAAASSSPTAATAARRCSTSPTWPCARDSPADRRSRSWCSGRSSTPRPGSGRCAEGTGLVARPACAATCRTRLAEALLAEAGVDPAGAASPSSAARSAAAWSTALAALSPPLDGRRGLPQGRGHGRRRGALRGRSAHPGEPPPSRPLPLRRDARRLRPDRRPQLRLGLGHRKGGGAGRGGGARIPPAATKEDRNR